VENIAIVRDSDGLVLTILRGDATPVVPVGFHSVAESQLPGGWSRIAAAADTPEFVTRWQIRTILWRQFAVPPEAVSAFIDSIEDVGQKTQARIDWDGPICRRDHPMVAGFAQQLGLTTEQTNQVFRDAAALER
jgi:hypothetical protein